MHISRKAIDKYGATEGCPACASIARWGHLTGRFGYNHNEACRNRIKELTTDDPEYGELIQRHQQGSEGDEISGLVLDRTSINVISTEHHQERLGHVREAIQHVKGNANQEGKIGMGSQLDQVTVQTLISSMDVANGRVLEPSEAYPYST